MVIYQNSLGLIWRYGSLDLAILPVLCLLEDVHREKLGKIVIDS